MARWQIIVKKAEATKQSKDQNNNNNNNENKQTNKQTKRLHLHWNVTEYGGDQIYV